MMEHEIDLWEKLVEDKSIKQKWTMQDGGKRPITYKEWPELYNKETSNSSNYYFV